MKKVLLAALFLTIGASVANAQAPTTPPADQAGAMQGPPRGGRKFDPSARAQATASKWAKKLNLSADQTTSVQSILTDQYSKAADVYKSTKPGTPERVNGIKQIRANADASLSKVFTPDQAQKYEKIKAEREAKAKQNLKDKLDELED